MAFSGEAHQLHVPFKQPQGHEELVCLFDGTPEVLFRVDDQQRRSDVADIADWRHACVQLGVVEMTGTHDLTEGAGKVAGRL